jgi:uncharacterized phage-associated protein
MTTAFEAAKYLIQLASADAEPMTHMRVQKLLYYAQGWHMGLFGKPLFGEPLQAWKNGPVVPAVYEAIRPVVDETPARPLMPSDFSPPALNGRDKVFIETVWKKYAGLSAAGLKELSHAEPPWVEARGSTEDGGHCETEITTESLRRYFGSQPEAVLPNPGDVEAVYEAEAAARERPPIPFAELRRRRRERA